MRLLTPSEVPASRLGFVCRESRINQFIGVFFSLAFLGGGYWFFREVDAPVWFELPISLFLMLFVYLAVSGFKKSLTPDNWVLRYDGSHLLLKFRSFYNRRFPSRDKQIVTIEPREVDWMRHLRRKIAFSSGHGDEIRTYSWIEIQLNVPVSVELKDALKHELSLQTGGTRINHSPVILEGENRLLVEWSSRNSRVTPSIEKALSHLSRDFVRKSMNDVGVDLSPGSGISEKEFEDEIIRMVMSGDDLRAQGIVRQFYKMSQTEAHLFVKELKK